MNTMHRMFLGSGLAFGLGLVGSLGSLGSLATLATLATLAVPGCGGGDYCAVVFNKQIECAPAEQKALFEGLKDLALKECRDKKDHDAEVEKSELECAQKAGCEDFKKCMDALNDAKYAKKVKKEIEAALATGEKLEEALSTCKFSDIKDDGVKKLCGDLFTKALDTATTDLQGIRDKGGDPEGKCFDLTLTAEKVSPEAKTKAEALCKEVDASRRATEAIAEAKKNLDAKTNEVPFQCGMAVEDLEKIGNDWSKTKLAEVTRACYVDLGNNILPAVVPTMQYICDYQVEQVFKNVKKYNLKDAALDPWIEKAAAKCAGQAAG